METTGYIIDVHSNYSRDHIILTFQLNGHWYDIKEVKLDEERKPILSSIIDDTDDSLYFHVYEKLDDAINFMRQLKGGE